MGLLDGALNLVKSVYNSVTGSDTSKKTAQNKGTKTNSTTKPKTENKPKTPATQKSQQKTSSVFTEKKTEKSSNSSAGDVVVKSKTTNTGKTTLPAKTSKIQNANKSQQANKPVVTPAETQKSRTASVSKLSAKSNVSTKKSNSLATSNTVTIYDVVNIQKEIKNKCEENGIEFEEFLNNITKDSFDVETFVELSNEDKMRVLLAMDLALSVIISSKNNENIENDIELNNFINNIVIPYSQNTKKLSVNSIKEVNQKISNVLVELTSKYNENLSAEEKDNLFYNAGVVIREEFQKQIAKSKIETNEAKKEIEDEASFAAESVIVAFSMQEHGLKNAKHAGKTFGPKHYGRGREFQIDISGGKYADMRTYQDELDDRKFYYEHGEALQADQCNLAIQYTLQNMKKEENVSQFEQSAYEFRIKYENGEIDAPYITPEHLTQESIAIGSGITSNANMTASQKAELLNQWDQHAAQFSDYGDVKSGYEKAIAEFVEKHPEAKGMVDELREKMSQTSTSVKNNETNISKLSENQANAYVTKVIQSEPIKKDSSVKVKETESIVSAKPTVTPTELKSELKTKSVKEIRESYSNSVHEIIHIVLHNDKELKNRIDEIIPHLDGMSGTDIGNLAYGCDTPVISKLISELPEKANDILQIVAPAMCFSGRKLAEQKVERQNQNEAA